MHFAFLHHVRIFLHRIQSILSFESWIEYPAFNSKLSLGRTAMVAFLLGVIMGVHIVSLCIGVYFRFLLSSSESSHLLIDTDRLQLLIQWCIYIICVCFFHLSEFFTTAIYNPNALSSDSFIVNHSYAYTGAAIVSKL
jgi:hypothetical protein